jgi:hypothetical protein
MEQMLYRNAVQLVPYVDITKANPHIPLFDEVEREKSQGLTQRLAELQDMMRHNYKQHRRRTIALLLLSLMYALPEHVGDVSTRVLFNGAATSGQPLHCHCMQPGGGDGCAGGGVRSV